MATTSAPRTLTNRFSVRVAAEKKEKQKQKQKQTLIATVSDRIDECTQDCEKRAPGVCGCGVVDRDLGFDNDGFPDWSRQILMATGSPMGTTSAPKTLTLTNRFPVRVAAEKKQKQKHTLIATVFPIVSTNAPKTAKRRRPVRGCGVRSSRQGLGFR
jgi:hypothetical protein